MATTEQNKDFTAELLPDYPLDDAIYWIQRNLEPRDVFSNTDLEKWAEENGWVKKEE